jgi:hypothetical protein
MKMLAGGGGLVGTSHVGSPKHAPATASPRSARRRSFAAAVPGPAARIRKALSKRHMQLKQKAFEVNFPNHRRLRRSQSIVHVDELGGMYPSARFRRQQAHRAKPVHKASTVEFVNANADTSDMAESLRARYEVDQTKRAHPLYSVQNLLLRESLKFDPAIRSTIDKVRRRVIRMPLVCCHQLVLQKNIMNNAHPRSCRDVVSPLSCGSPSTPTGTGPSIATSTSISTESYSWSFAAATACRRRTWKSSHSKSGARIRRVERAA